MGRTSEHCAADRGADAQARSRYLSGGMSDSASETVHDPARGATADAGRLKARDWGRSALLLALVLLLHALVLFGLRRESLLDVPARPTQTTLSVALLKAPPKIAVIAAAAPAPAKPAAALRPAMTAAPAPPSPMPAPASPAPEPPPPAPAPPAPLPPAAVEPPAPAPEPVPDPPPGLPPGLQELPTQGRIAYRTTYTRMRGIDALTYVDWTIDLDRGRYELWLRTVDPPGLLDLRSSGELRPFGIAPFAYVERIDIANRELRADFDWDTHTVRFAGRGATEPAHFTEGTQDPLSLQFHLPLLAQSYPWQFTPGAVLSVQVARRRVEGYSFAVDGFEPMVIGGRTVHTLKIIRPKGPESNRGVEMWMAPEFDWLPVRLRFVDTNDEVWDSVLAHLPGTEPPAAPVQQEVVKP